MEPQALFDGGAIAPLRAPLAPYKGFGLALVVDALSGVLAGGAFGQDVVRGPASALLWALDVEAFLPRDEFLERMDAQIDQVKQAQPIVGGVELMVPGERGARRAAEHAARGTVPLGAASWQILLTCCQSLGVALPEVLAA